MASLLRPISKEEEDDFRELYPPRAKASSPRCAATTERGDARLRHLTLGSTLRCSRAPEHEGPHLVADMGSGTRDPVAYWVRGN